MHTLYLSYFTEYLGLRSFSICEPSSLTEDMSTITWGFVQIRRDEVTLGGRRCVNRMRSGLLPVLELTEPPADAKDLHKG